MNEPLIIGIFVGGRATRMGGAPKGLLSAPDTGEPLVRRLARISREAFPSATVFRVGFAPAYAGLEIPELVDDPKDIGPLGGLSALLLEANSRRSEALAIAGDLPYVTSELVTRVARFAPGAAAAAPRRSGKWEPLFARYSPEPCLPIVRRLIEAKRHGLRRIFEALGERAVEVPVDEDSAALLSDWDSPEDVQARS